MGRETEQLRDLLFGQGEFTRAEAPEPSLIPILLNLVSAGVSDNERLLDALDEVVRRYPDLRRGMLTSLARQLDELPSDRRHAMLHKYPLMVLEASPHVLEEGLGAAQEIEDPADRALFLIKLAARNVGNRDRLMREVRNLIRLPTAREDSRLDALYHLAELSTGLARMEAIEELLASPNLVREPDLAASVATLLKPAVAARLSHYAVEEARELSAGSPELRAWALARLAPGLRPEEQTSVLREALDATQELPAQWQQAQALNNLRTALRRPEIGSITRAAVEPLVQRIAGSLRQLERLPEQAAKLGTESQEADPEGTEQLAREAILGTLRRWYPSEEQAVSREPVGHPTAIPEEEDSDTLGVEQRSVRRGQAAKPPQPSLPPTTLPPAVNTGFANPAHPGGHLAKSRPIVPGERYYFWLQVGDAAGSIEERATPLPVELLPSEARLVVVLFSPDGGFRQEPGEDIGELVLDPDGSARVVAQPGTYDEEAEEEEVAWFERRLLFPVIASPTPGEYRLRCSIYCQGVLVQSRIVTVEVGGIRRLSRLDYSLASRLEASKLQTLAEHRFSMLSNHRSDGNHDFYIYGGNGKRAFRDALTIPAKTVDDALQLAHAAMRRASWGDEEPWASTKKYRYGGPPALETLRHDLAVLAIAGYRIYDLLANQLAGGEAKVDEFTALVREPGLVQISPDADLGMVLPAALIYDYEVELGTALPKFRLCPDFERAYREKTPLQDTACFQGNCPIRGEDTSVCPSGFWGFRHGLGLPISDSTAGKTAEADFNVRLEYGEVPVIIVGISRSRDLPRTKEHTEELQALRPAWGNKGWLVVDQRNRLLELMRSKQPHVVYFYCHGSGRQVGSIEIPMLYLGENPQAAQPGEWLERATLRKKIRWTKPRPLVFLNGCRTTVLTAKTTLDFVTGFVQNAKACGVVGTEVTVFEPLAGEFARRFLERFLSGISVGQAIRDTRLDLLQQGNPLGLVYTPFVLSGTQLVRTGT